MHSKGKLFPIAISLLTTSVIASADLIDSATSAISDGMGSISSSVSGLFNSDAISNVFSIPGLNVQKVNCAVGLDRNLLSEINSMCGLVKDVFPDLSVGVGPCTLNSDQSKCANSYITSYCRNLAKNVTTTTKEGEAILLSPVNVTGLSTKHNILTGGDIVMTGKRMSCDNRVQKMYSGVDYGSSNEEKIYNATKMKNLRGKSAFTRDVELTRDALRMGASAGKINVNETSANWVMNKGMGLPQTITQAQKNINETVALHLDSPDNKLASGMVKTEAAVEEKLANCSASSDYELCKNTQLNSSASTNIPKMTDSAVAKTEMGSAKMLKLMEDAGRGKRLIVHYDDESITNLPMESKGVYASAMRRQIAFQTAYRYLAAESASISKEVIRISTQKMTESARPFFEDQALKEIAGAIK